MIPADQVDDILIAVAAVITAFGTLTGLVAAVSASLKTRAEVRAMRAENAITAGHAAEAARQLSTNGHRGLTPEDSPAWTAKDRLDWLAGELHRQGETQAAQGESLRILARQVILNDAAAQERAASLRDDISAVASDLATATADLTESKADRRSIHLALDALAHVHREPTAGSGQ